MPKLHFTKRSVDALPYPKAGQVLYRDETLTGLGVRVGTQSKVYFVEGQVLGRTKRISIGRTDVFSVDAARKVAMGHLIDMAGGVDPNAKKRQLYEESITVAAAFNQFLQTRGASLATSTVEIYRRTFSLYLKDWAKMPLVSITRQMVLKRHQRVGKDHGVVTANNVMRHFRSVYNVAAASHDSFPANPATILTQARAWHQETRRRTSVAALDLPAWWAAVMHEPDYARDFLLIALFTGMRRNEIASLRWEYIDLRGRALHIPKTKNGDPLDLPLSTYLVELFQTRRVLAGKSSWVFPSNGKTGHIVETKKFTARVTERSGVKFTMHDLRRTFISIAESLDIPHYALKRLLNHRLSGDVTAGYIVSNAERLRGPVDAVAAEILKRASAIEAHTHPVADQDASIAAA
jgi:integrase